MSILLDAQETQLVLVDYQVKLMPVIHESTQILLRAQQLAQVAALFEVPIVLTEQNSSKLGASDPRLRSLSNQVIQKMSFSACQEGLSESLRPQRNQQRSGNARSLPKHVTQKQEAQERSTILIAGCETHVCVLQTALDLLDEEFDVCVVTDACGSRTQANKDAAFDRLASHGAELVTTEMVVFEFLKTCEDSRFKQALEIIK